MFTDERKPKTISGETVASYINEIICHLETSHPALFEKSFLDCNENFGELLKEVSGIHNLYMEHKKGNI